MAGVVSRLFCFERNSNMCSSRSSMSVFYCNEPTILSVVYFEPDERWVVYTEVVRASTPRITDATCVEDEECRTREAALHVFQLYLCQLIFMTTDDDDSLCALVATATTATRPSVRLPA